MFRRTGSLLLMVFCLLSAFVSFGQNTYVDSLKTELSKGGLADTAKVRLLVKIGDNIVMNDPHSASEYFGEAYTLSQKLKNNYLTALSLSGVGLVYDYKSEDDSAMYFYQKADSFYAIVPTQESRESRVSNKTSMGNIERNRNHFGAAIQIFLDAAAMMEKSTADNKWQVLGIIYSDIASVYHDMKQYDKALDYDLKALRAHQRQNENNLFTAYTELFVAQDFNNLDQTDSSLKYLQIAEKTSKGLNSTDINYQLYSGYGQLFSKEKKLDEALKYYQKALSVAMKGGRKFRQMDSYRMLGFVYADRKQYQQSILNLEKALVLVRQIQNKNLEAGILKRLAEAESAVGNYRLSSDHFAKYIYLNDSLKEQESKKKINEIENKYQAQKKQKAIDALRQANLLQTAELKQKQILNIALVGGFVLLLIAGALIYNNFKNKHRLLQQNEELSRQKIRELEKERKLVAAQSLMEGQEEERTRLARDLHDGVGGLLSGVKLSMSNMKENVFLSQSNVDSFNNVIRQLDQSIAELRRVSHNMMPESLVKFGLKETLENYCERLNYSGQIKVQLQTYGMDARMEQSTEIVIYRMIQELLNNAVKHAEAKNVLIQLVREKERFNLTVEDDGKGFDVSKVDNGSSAGLNNIRARAAYLNGTVDIRSSEGEGTSVHVEGDCTISS
ncbi:MAG: tetratricopeptide repeat-containing sensor histidine kinase [Ginsengibacter sp.]